MNIAKVHLRLRRLPAVIMVLLVTVVSVSMAQRFEEYFGANCVEQGFGGVPLVGGGYASVGYTTSLANGNCFGTSQVYVVCLNSNGTQAWARAYNLGGSSDAGHDIRQCANGDLIVVGTSSGNPSLGNGDLFIMRLSSATGAVIWATLYGTATLSETGNRIIETTLSAGGSSSAGDFVAVGMQSGGTTGTDGFMLRVTSGGGVVWMNTYGAAGIDALTAVDESTVGINASDIIAVGYSSSFQTCGTMQGLVMRVNGATGAFGLPPQGAAVYGRGEYVDLQSVDELTVGGNAGQIVCAGQTWIGSNSDIYVLKTGAYPCSEINDATYGDADSATELAYAVREIVSGAGGGLNNGNLMLSGISKVYTQATGSQGFLLELDPSLAIVTPPAGVGYRVYGAGSNKLEWGEPVLASTGVTTAGFYLTGYVTSSSDQVYLVKTDNLGITGCTDTAFTPVHTRPRLQPNCILVPNAPVGKKVPLKGVLDTARIGDSVYCNDSLAMRGSSRGGPGFSGAGDGRMNMLVMAGGDLSTSSISAGSTLTLGYRLKQAGKLSVMVADDRGRRIYRHVSDADAGLAHVVVPTAGWSPGSYVVSAKVGDRAVVDRIVVNDR